MWSSSKNFAITELLKPLNMHSDRGGGFIGAICGSLENSQEILFICTCAS